MTFAEVAMMDTGAVDLLRSPGFALRYGRRIKKEAGPRLAAVIEGADRSGVGRGLPRLEQIYARLLRNEGDVEGSLTHLKRALLASWQ